ncbi:MAG: EVE domain-containing protein [Bdellovibrionaceae bacterium]|nr:EVE domain-containing protein [Pseudobdellovibrionaceae bacterium]
MAKKYWLMKSEPETYSISHLQKDKKTWWTGVRNYQARNFMMNDMNVGDEILFYHSNAEPPGVAGLARVSKKAEPDATQFDKKSEVFDPKASKEKPIWFCVEVEFVAEFKNFVSLETLKETKSLEGMQVLKKGQRLSVQPATKAEFDQVKKLGS